MAHYVVAKVTIKDREAYKPYEAGFMEIFNRYDGKMLSVDENPTVLEGSWSVTRTVLVEFPSKEALLAWYESDEYQAIAEHRYAASTADIVIIEGL